MHPTDFSDLSINAFVHALKIGLTVKTKLYVLHIAERRNEDPRHAFPHVRQTLARWGLFDENQLPSELTPKLGIKVAKVEVESQDHVTGLLRFLARHPSDLMVLGTHGREGLPRWLRPSIAEAMSRRSANQTLFISAQCRGFVDQANGAIKLKRILVPVDHSSPPATGLRAVKQFCRILAGKEAIFHVVHVGARAPALKSEASSPVPVELRSGNVVDGIVQAAADVEADLIGMATAGHNGILDAFRGSTTERVLRKAPCPVLAVPIVGSR
jgi:nucleotide-binding universal stress UspA family protein